MFLIGDESEPSAGLPSAQASRPSRSAEHAELGCRSKAIRVSPKPSLQRVATRFCRYERSRLGELFSSPSNPLHNEDQHTCAVIELLGLIFYKIAPRREPINTQVGPKKTSKLLYNLRTTHEYFTNVYILKGLVFLT